MMFRQLLALSGDRSGSTVLLTAIAFPVLLGFAGLAVDVVSWYSEKRVVQASANAAAVAAALETFRGASRTGSAAAATSDAERNGFDPASDSIIVESPPSSGSFAGKAGAVAVTVRRRATVYFAQAFLRTPVEIAGRAVALADSEGANTCVWVLDAAQRASLKVAGGADVTLDCGVVVNSRDSEALTQSGTGSCLTATRIKVVGGLSGDCVQGLKRTGIAPVADPLAALAAPVYGGCDQRSNIKVNSSQTRTLDPGVYCGGIDVMAGGQLHLNPGTYVLDGAGLKVASSGKLTGSEVFIYSSENSGNSAGIGISGGASVSLSAPRTGRYAGMLFYHDRRSPTNVTHSFTGGSGMQLDGTLYFPNQDLQFAGGSSAAQTSSVLIARTLSFTGHTSVDIKIAQGAAARTSRLLSRALLVE